MHKLVPTRIEVTRIGVAIRCIVPMCDIYRGYLNSLG